MVLKCRKKRVAAVLAGILLIQTSVGLRATAAGSKKNGTPSSDEIYTENSLEMEVALSAGIGTCLKEYEALPARKNDSTSSLKMNPNLYAGLGKNDFFAVTDSVCVIDENASYAVTGSAEVVDGNVSCAVTGSVGDIDGNASYVVTDSTGVNNENESYVMTGSTEDVDGNTSHAVAGSAEVVDKNTSYAVTDRADVIDDNTSLAEETVTAEEEQNSNGQASENGAYYNKEERQTKSVAEVEKSSVFEGGKVDNKSISLVAGLSGESIFDIQKNSELETEISEETGISEDVTSDGQQKAEAEKAGSEKEASGKQSASRDATLDGQQKAEAEKAKSGKKASGKARSSDNGTVDRQKDVENEDTDISTEKMPRISAGEAPAKTQEAETASDAAVGICGFEELGMPAVEDYLNIRMEPSEESEIAGHLNRGSGCEIEGQEGEWTKIRSGDVEGYVKSEFLLTGQDAAEEAEAYAQEVAVIQTDGLNVRKKASQKSKVISQVEEGEEISCLSVDDGWAKVELEESSGYVSADYISVEKTLETAVSTEELKYGTGIDAVRAKLVEKACSYVGNPYVWGGTSLTNGIDCSGFTMQIYAEYGIGLPHYSVSQSECGRAVSAEELAPGDLVFYADGGGTINHVAIYMGNGMVVHAKNSRAGITTTDMYYRTPVKMVRLLEG